MNCIYYNIIYILLLLNYTYYELLIMVNYLLLIIDY